MNIYVKDATLDLKFLKKAPMGRKWSVRSVEQKRSKSFFLPLDFLPEENSSPPHPKERLVRLAI
jgi:hypothetical protein